MSRIDRDSVKHFETWEELKPLLKKNSKVSLSGLFEKNIKTIKKI